jgi:Uma2 family endonuclease
MANETALEPPVWMGDPAWDPPIPPTDLIFDDGEPLESNRHRIAMNVLIRSAQFALSDRPDSFVGGNMFVYYSRNQAMNRDFRGPHFFAVLGVDGNRERQGWVVWEEEGRYPDVIIELLSPSTATTDRGAKKDLSGQTFKTTDYFIFDPFTPTSLEGWQLVTSQGYQPLQPNKQGWLWSETLGLWLGTWEGAIDQEPASGTCHWLRFYDRDNNLVLLPEESAQQQAHQERQRAEQECERAEQEHQRAEQECERAEQEHQRAERLAARLRELGVTPENL